MIPTVKVDADGTKSWWINGQRHRTDGPAIEWADGTKAWWINGQRHRTDGPAIEWADGDKAWWINGQRHREDGPAIEYTDGHKAWYWHGSEVDQLTHLVLRYQSTLTVDSIHSPVIISA